MKVEGGTSVCLLLLLSPWCMAAKLRNLKGNDIKRRKHHQDGFDETWFQEHEMVEVIIGLNVEEEEPTFTAMSNTIDLLSNSVSLEELIPQIKSGVARVPVGMLEKLRQDPKVKYVEYNGRVHEDSETIPAGIQKSLHTGRLPLDLTPSAGLKFDCSDSDSFRIAVVDGGVDVSHYDFEFCGIFDQNGQVDPNREQHCMGKAFLRSSDASDGQDWYNTKRDHGMHVAGIVAASGLNDAGVMGMISDEKICLVIARVFGDGGGASVAKVAEAIIWAADTGSKVINMSLGTSTAYAAVTDAIKYAHDKGAILIGSSGNGADDDPPVLVNFPADYPQVISVAAVDIGYNWATFSNYNENVDIAAVGVDVMSTLPLPDDGTTFEIVSDAGRFSGIHMIYSKYTSSVGVRGGLVDCGRGNGPCPGDGGHVCLIERGGSPYYTKVLMCELSNGVAAIIYSDDDTDVLGSMGHVNNSPRFTVIPAVGIGRDAGIQLLGIEGTEVTVTSRLLGGYGTMSGTSMAAPHVAGAAGLLWRSCSDCPREDIVGCLLTTADDVGDEGKDVYYGSGVLNTEKALVCLKSQSCCLSPGPETIMSNTRIPSHAPSAVPSRRPISTPTRTPTRTPSKVPTLLPTINPTTDPTVVPSSFPTAFKSASPTVIASIQCSLHCEDKDQFCSYKANRTCTGEKESCITSCEKAVIDGIVAGDIRETCETVWCANDMERCVAQKEIACDADSTECQQLCRTG